MKKIEIGDTVYFMNQDDFMIVNDIIVEITQTADGYEYFTANGNRFVNPELFYTSKESFAKAWLDANGLAIEATLTNI
jgi:hypothetical protein